MSPSVRACATAALLALCAVLVAAPAPARADLAAGLAPPPATAAPNVSDLVTDGLDATGVQGLPVLFIRSVPIVFAGRRVPDVVHQARGRMCCSDVPRWSAAGAHA